jgi:16S rRNA (cytosine967-C5)-methyltransferase
MNSRQVAAHLVDLWLETAQFPDQLLETVQEDRAFVSELVLGIMRRRRSLEWFLDRLMKTRPHGPLGACLMVGAYQELFMDHVADYASVNETVEAARALSGKRSTGLVNGVLRSLNRQRDQLMVDFAETPLAVRESHPDLLVSRWEDGFGPEATESLCHWNNERPSLCICLDRDRVTPDSFMQRLEEAGTHAQPHEAAPDRSIQLSPGVNVTELPGFREGLFSIQDPATFHAVQLLSPMPGESILDACAAPGGKSILIAQSMKGEGRHVAMDINVQRLRRMRDNAGRMRMPVDVKTGDARRDDLKQMNAGEPFDKILLDVPCTNTGVLRRRPDARWRFSLDKMKALVTLQKELLSNAANAVRPGGSLVYSTCSLEPEENQELVDAWCSDHPNFERGESIFCVPPDSGTDGAFAAKLVRTG